MDLQGLGFAVAAMSAASSKRGVLHQTAVARQGSSDEKKEDRREMGGW